MPRPLLLALTSNGVGTCGPDDNQAQAGHLITTFRKAQKAHDPDDCERWQADDLADTLDASGHAARTATAVVAETLRSHPRPGSNSVGAVVVQPLAVRGRYGGAQLEIGPEGGPFNALRAGDGGSSRSALVAVTATGDTSHTLTAEGSDASEDGSGRGTPVIAFAWQAGGNNDASGAYEEEMSPTLPKAQTMAVQTETTVRRLTPLEAERLQGFPDNWTATSNGKPQADSPRYRQMGNAVAVPCVEWIVQRLVAVDSRMRIEREP